MIKQNIFKKVVIYLQNIYVVCSAEFSNKIGVMECQAPQSVTFDVWHDMLLLCWPVEFSNWFNFVTIE